MRLLLLTIFLALLLPAAPNAADDPDKTISGFVLPCRETFPDVVANPSEKGGWRILDLEGHRLLCLYGSFPMEILPALTAELDPAVPVTITVRSTGGPAESWLALAEHLQGTAVDLVIDEACFSSCANYLPVIARSIRAAESSLLVWHGGPSDNPDEDTMLTMASLFEFVAYDSLARRTQKLYAGQGVSIELLRVSGLRTSEAVMNGLMEDVKPKGTGLSVAGYAFSPDTLVDCFGMAAAKGMWHAGADADLVRLAQKRDAGMIVLESPKTDAGERICVAHRFDANPADTR
jgi:hypothetical protein